MNGQQRTETEIRLLGIKSLIDVLGGVDAERFVSLLSREPFDYTDWQSNLWNEKSVEEISKSAMEYRRQGLDHP